jgi:3-oxoacyl-[acyl-carrier protein] reductase
VTGATGGIGLAVCDRLAKAGASLFLAARDVGKLQLLCSQLPDNGSVGHAWIRSTCRATNRFGSLATSSPPGT